MDLTKRIIAAKPEKLEEIYDDVEIVPVDGHEEHDVRALLEAIDRIENEERAKTQPTAPLTKPKELVKSLPDYNYNSTEKAPARPRRALLVGLITIALIIAATTIYSGYKRTAAVVPVSVAASRVEPNKQRELELIRMVRRAPAKLPASTISQDLLSHLNNRGIEDNQRAGWQVESLENNSAIVKFQWTEQGAAKEARWRIDLTNNQIKAVNPEAALIGP